MLLSITASASPMAMPAQLFLTIRLRTIVGAHSAAQTTATWLVLPVIRLNEMCGAEVARKQAMALPAPSRSQELFEMTLLWM